LNLCKDKSKGENLRLNLEKAIEKWGGVSDVYQLEWNIVNDVVGCCAYYEKDIDYSNIESFSQCLNLKIFKGKKIYVYWFKRGY
jgi:hypothetical protein